jgi:phage-related protein
MIVAVMAWTVVLLDDRLAAELAAQPEDIRAKFVRISLTIEQLGLERVREPYVKHLQGRLWEMRMSGRDGIARAIYATVSGQRVVVLRVFSKKTQKAPRRELAIARVSAEEIE